jgi:hypothetical protein
LLGLLLLGVTLPVSAEEHSVSLVGQIGGECRDVQVVGNYAYVGEGTSLRVLDVSNPAKPIPRGRVRLPGIVQGVFVSGGRAYVTDGASLQIADIANPSSPTLLGAYTTPAKRVWVSGNLAYVATGSSLKIITVANPSSPTLRTTYNAPATNVYLSGATAYLSGDKLRILDVSNPSSPTLRSIYDTPVNDVVVSGTLAYLACPAFLGLKILDVSNPSSATLRGTLAVLYGQSVRVSGSRVYVSWMEDPYTIPREAGFRIVDASNPSQPRLLGEYNNLRYPWTLSLADGLAYVADGLAGLLIIDIDRAAQPVLRGSYSPASCARDVCVSGNLAYVASGDGGLQIVDVSNPTLPTPCGSYRTPGEAMAICISNNLAYVTWQSMVTFDEAGGLQIIDITDPSSPTLRGSCDVERWTYDVAVSGGLAYLGRSPGALTIVDVSKPSSPTLLGSYNWQSSVPFGYSRIAVGADCAYVACLGTGLPIIDTSNPSSPTLRATYPTGAYDVQVLGNRAYVASRSSLQSENGLKVLDVSNPSSPTLLGFRRTQCNNVCVFVNTAYISWGTGDQYRGWSGGLEIMDVSDARSLRRFGSYDLPTWSAGISASNNLAYVANYNAGLVILRYTPPPAPSNLRASAISWDQIDLQFSENNTLPFQSGPSFDDDYEFERKVGSAGAWAKATITVAREARTLVIPVRGGGYYTYYVTVYRDMRVSPGIVYYYRMRAHNTVGYSPYSNVTSATITNAPPAAPSNLRTDTSSNGSFSLVWYDNASNEQGFKIERKIGASGSWMQVTTATANTAEFSPSAPPPDIPCFYRVRAYNPMGNSPYSYETAFTLVTPAAPSNLRAKAASTSKITLSWQDNSDNERGFYIYRKTASSAIWTRIGQTYANGSSFSDTGLSPYEVYTYRVSAYNWVVESFSNEVSLGTTAARPAWSLYE